VNTDQQNNGLQTLVTYDRPTAARLGLTPQLLDNSLYDAFGQAEVSTIYTQLNQYYVVMEAAPKYWQSPQGLNETYLIPNVGGARSSSIGCEVRGINFSPGSKPHRAFSISHRVVQSCAWRLSGEATQEIESAQQKLNMPALSMESSPEHCRRFNNPSQRSLI